MEGNIPVVMYDKVIKYTWKSRKTILKDVYKELYVVLFAFNMIELCFEPFETKVAKVKVVKVKNV